jgi:N-acetylglucosamine-6-phosphate deacetylase
MAGAHNSEYLSLPDESMASLWARSGVVSIVTMAPELQGASAVTSILSEAGILVSIGHTAADYRTAKASLEGPRPSVTHLFNQMTPFRHRDSGVVGAAWMSEAVCGLIVDGLHSEPDAVRLAWRILGSDRTALVTDSMAAFGIGNGNYVLGSAEVTVDESGPRLVDGRLAGSVLSLVDALRNLVMWTEASVDEAVLAVTRTPAALVGLTDRGEIRDGSRGDVVVLTESLEIRATIIGGEVIYDAGAA